MKRQNLSFAKGKSTLLLLLVAAGIAIGVTSCSKNDDDKTTPGVTSDNAAVMVTQSVTAQGGLVEQLNSATLTISALEARKASGARLSDFCGQTEQDSFKLAGSGNNISYDYALVWQYGLTCQQTIPSQFSFDFTGHAKLGLEKFATSNTFSSTYHLSGLGANSENWEISQTYDATGDLTSKTADIPSFSSEIHYESVDIKVKKATREIVSGSAAVKITGTDSKGNSYSYQGLITFKGGKKATFIVNGGGTFELQWN
jgi:hypothetical protein